MSVRSELADDLTARALSVTPVEIDSYGTATELVMPNGTKVLIYRDNVMAHLSTRGKLTVDGLYHHVKYCLRGVGAVWYYHLMGKSANKRTARRACATLCKLATA
tara:strand:- start:52429 stop:52743 length:315 start_codon:yes stop_codon:yes gene_type:complete